MNDRRVAEALRSSARMVIVEAPAGFGKTFQGAQYAKDVLTSIFPGRLLILTHTNAACDVFADRTLGHGSRVEIRTIDSLITKIATIYHETLGIPADVPTWARQQGTDGFNLLAQKVARLLERAPSISASLATRYPYVVCDEHQDSNAAQHQVILSIHHAGAFTRIFIDPMQAIYGGGKDRNDWEQRWVKLQSTADKRVELEIPHRWKDCAPELGDWIRNARNELKAGREIDLCGRLPREIKLIRADNSAQRHGQFILSKSERLPIDSFVRTAPELLVLASTNATVLGLRAFFNRSIPIWEGHTRDALWELMLACQQHTGNATALTDAFIDFVQNAGVGFSDSSYGRVIRREAAEGCSSARSQKPKKLQSIARLIVDCPDHRGVARALRELENYVSADQAFKDIKLDLRREFADAVRMGQHENPLTALHELALSRNIRRPHLPTKGISTIHKAKGIERDNILIVPCDKQHFPATDDKRRLLYVALSRAKKTVALVIPRHTPSALFRL